MAQVLQCDVAIVRLTNLDVLDLPPGSSLFVRYYVAIGGGRRIRVDTRKLPCTGEEARWDERASLECRGGSSNSSSTVTPLKVLLHELCRSSAVVFELRCCRRSATTIWGKAAGSRLLGRGEVAWSDAVGSPPGVSVERCVIRLVTPTKKKNQKLQQPAAAAAALLVRIGVRLEASETAVTQNVRRRGRQQWVDDGECKCGSCGWVGSEEDLFLTATAASMTVYF